MRTCSKCGAALPIGGDPDHQCAMTDHASDEEWRVITAFPDYSVSDQGRIRRDSGGIGATAGRIMRQQSNHGGYLTVGLANGTGKGHTHLVHRLVAIAFHGLPTESAPHVNHINAVKTDNRAVNIEWCSHAENIAHSERLGLPAIGRKMFAANFPRGDESPSAILTESVIPDVFILHRAGWTRGEIARRLSVSAATIGDIIRGRHWRSVWL